LYTTSLAEILQIRKLQAWIGKMCPGDLRT
jgi:hypothetical protein